MNRFCGPASQSHSSAEPLIMMIFRIALIMLNPGNLSIVRLISRRSPVNPGSDSLIAIIPENFFMSVLLIFVIRNCRDFRIFAESIRKKGLCHTQRLLRSSFHKFGFFHSSRHNGDMIAVTEKNIDSFIADKFYQFYFPVLIFGFGDIYL